MELSHKSGISGFYQIFEIPKNEITSRLSDDGNFDELKKHATKKQEFHNIVPDVALQSFAENMVTAGASLPAANELRVTYIAVGTSATAPVAGNTTLGTEVFRYTIDSQSRNSKTAKNAILIGFSEANGNTLREVGAFAGAASGTANSGTLMSHALFGTSIVKDATKAVFIEVQHIFADA